MAVESFTRLFTRFAVMSAVVPTSTIDNYRNSGPSNNTAQCSLDRDALGNRFAHYERTTHEPLLPPECVFINKRSHLCG